MLADEMLKGY